MRFWSKFENKKSKTFNSVPFIKKIFVNHFFYSNLIILTDFHNFTVNEDKLHNFLNLLISAKVRVCDLGQNLKITETS